MDELGYLPIDKTGADLLFQARSQRYERGSTVITTNRVYRRGPEIFNNDAPTPPPCSTDCCTTPKPSSSREKVPNEGSQHRLVIAAAKRSRQPTTSKW